MAVLAWTVLPLVILHAVMATRWRSLLRCQLLLDVILLAAVGPALLSGGDLNPVHCLSSNATFNEWQWSEMTEFEPTQSDVVLQFHPWWEEAREQLLAGRLPRISPTIGGGLPLLANGQVGLFAPMMVPVWALGPERGTTVMAWWKIELAGLGAFFFFAHGLRLRRPAATLGAVALAGSAYQIAWLLVPLGWVTAALPWFWWLFIRMGRGPWGWRRVLTAGAACGWLLGSGLHPETAAIVVGSALLVLLFRHPLRWKRALVAILIATPIMLLLAWPNLLYINSSARVHSVRVESPNHQPIPGKMRLQGARQLLLPKINGQPSRGDWQVPYPSSAGATGIGSVALALLAVGGIDRRRWRLAWAGLANLAVVAVLVYRVPPLDWLLVRMPPIDRMTLVRFQVLVPCALALLAALAMDGMVRGEFRQRFLWWIPAGLLTVVAALSWPWHLTQANVVLVAVGVLLAWLTPLLRRRVTIVPWLVSGELALLALGVNPVAAPQDRLPRPPLVRELEALQPGLDERLLGLGGMLPANLAGRYGIADLRAYDPLRPLVFTEFMAVLGQKTPILGGALQRAPPGLCGAFSVRYLITRPGVEAEGWDPVWSGAGGRIWRNPQWQPEIRLVGEVVVADAEDGWKVLAAPTFDPGSAAVVPPPFAPVADLGGELEIVFNEPDRVLARVRSDGATLLVLARPWAPGWRAEIDGVRTDVVRANLAGLGVRVPAGEHEVGLVYHAWSW